MNVQIYFPRKFLKWYIRIMGAGFLRKREESIKLYIFVWWFSSLLADLPALCGCAVRENLTAGGRGCAAESWRVAMLPYRQAHRLPTWSIGSRGSLSVCRDIAYGWRGGRTTNSRFPSPAPGTAVCGRCRKLPEVCCCCRKFPEVSGSLWQLPEVCGYCWRFPEVCG